MDNTNTPKAGSGVTEAMRAEFEAVFPVPPDCIWCGNGYAPTEYNAWLAQEHCKRWEGWRAAYQSRQPIAEGAAVVAAGEPVSAYASLLGELLAVLHRDGGHYQREHGTVKAVEDAIKAFYATPAAGAGGSVGAIKTLLEKLLLEAELFWWNDGPKGKSAHDMHKARDEVLAYFYAINTPAPEPSGVDKISTRHCGHPEHPGCEDCTPPAPEQATGVTDAKRYRFLKMFSTTAEQQELITKSWQEWDEFIDAAIASNSGEVKL